MAFFPRNLYHSHHSNNNTDGSFTPLFRLLDDFDNYSRQGGGASSNTRRLGLQTWQPKFDIRETADNYELHGELAGLSKEDVHIEFSDPQTIQIRGKVERTYTAGTPPAGLLGGTSSASAITEGGEEVFFMGNYVHFYNRMIARKGSVYNHAGVWRTKLHSALECKFQREKVADEWLSLLTNDT